MGVAMEATTTDDGANSGTPSHSRVPNYRLRIWTGYALSIVAAAVVGCVGYFMTQELVLSSEWLEHTHTVIEHLDALPQAMLDLQVGTRGYILSGNQSELADVVAGRSSIESELAAIQRLTSDNPAQQERLKALSAAIARRLAIASDAIAARRANDSRRATEIIFAGDTPALTDTIRNIIARMAEEESGLLRLRRAQEAYNFNLMVLVIVCGSIASLLLVSFAGVFINKMLQALRESLGELADSQGRLAERSRLEAARFRTLLETSPEAMIVSNQRGEIAIVNSRAEQLFGYTRAELLGQKIETLLPERLRGIHLGHREAYYAKPVNRSMGAGRDLVGLRKDGTEFPIEVSLGPIETDQGPVVSTVIVDITARKAAERELSERREALARSNEELEQFAYVASHDLQEPLRMVASYVQLLAQRYQGRLDSDADDFIRFAADGATRMKTLINDLLAYARVGSRGKPLQRVELVQVLEQALSNLAMAVNESRAEVTCDRLPAVIGDAHQLAELLQNLIGNAIKFQSSGSPRIHIGAEHRDGEWIVSVRDNGIGIDPQFRERIFVIFQRLHGREEYAGTGIGLAICKKIVTRHGGRIWADSEPGQGATFSFTVPAAEKEAYAA
jgi:PAS domain S-box-containing protein